MSARRLGLGLALAFSVVVAGRVDAAPVFHGALDVHTASGPIAPNGTASLTVRRWTLRLGRAGDGRDSNGIDPATEPIIFAIGEQQFLVPAGSLRVSRGGRRFVYASHERSGVRSFRLTRRTDGSYVVSFAIGGIDLSVLTGDVRICRPAALIIGDDDGFIGLDLTRRDFGAPRYRLRGTCDVSNDWPWIQG